MLGSLIAMLLFIVLGITFFAGKGSFLVGGFNTMGEREQEGYDTVALGKFMGKTMFGFAFAMLLTVISNVFEIVWLYKVSFVLIIGIGIFAIIYVYAKTRNRFKK